MLAEVRADLQHVLLAQIGDDVDRVELGDLGQRGLLAAAPDDIARIDQVLADDAVKRRPDLRVAEVQLGERHTRLGSEQLRFCASALINPFVDLDLGCRILFEECCIANDLSLCV